MFRLDHTAGFSKSIVSYEGSTGVTTVEHTRGGWAEVHDGFIIYQEVGGSIVKTVPMRRVDRITTSMADE